MNPIAILMTFGSFILVMGLRYGAQAAVAGLLGDNSPAREGRLTVNPARHLAALGTCVALIFSFPVNGLPVGLGWGRPIQPDARRLRVGANTGLVIVALAGIVTNLLVGLIIALALGQIHQTAGAALCVNSGLSGGPLQGCLAGWQPGWLLRVEQFAFIFASVNIVVGLLNIIPLYPLDGYYFLFTALPNDAAVRYRNSQSTQEFILAGVLFLVPLLLSLTGLPAFLAPGTLVHDLSYNLMGIFTPFFLYAQLL
jgi:Zn-dependent protease